MSEIVPNCYERKKNLSEIFKVVWLVNRKREREIVRKFPRKMLQIIRFETKKANGFDGSSGRVCGGVGVFGAKNMYSN